jgi:hypothetical protein
MTLTKARANASTKAKHIYNTGVNYDLHLRSLKYFYSAGHWAPWPINIKVLCLFLRKLLHFSGKKSFFFNSVITSRFLPLFEGMGVDLNPR